MSPHFSAILCSLLVGDTFVQVARSFEDTISNVRMPHMRSTCAFGSVLKPLYCRYEYHFFAQSSRIHMYEQTGAKIMEIGLANVEINRPSISKLAVHTKCTVLRGLINVEDYLFSGIRYLRLNPGSTLSVVCTMFRA